MTSATALCAALIPLPGPSPRREEGGASLLRIIWKREAGMTAEPISGLALWGAKLMGAAAGSAISVAYLLPEGRREAAARFLVGLVTGLVFGAPAGLALAERLGLGGALAPSELAMMGSAAASLCAWWALGVISRFASGLFRGEAKGAAGGGGPSGGRAESEGR